MDEPFVKGEGSRCEAAIIVGVKLLSVIRFGEFFKSTVFDLGTWSLERRTLE